MSVLELRDATFGYLADAPICLVALDPQTHRAIQVNNTFTRCLGPLCTFEKFPFAESAFCDEGKERLRSAIGKAAEAAVSGAPANVSIRVKHVEMRTLSEERQTNGGPFRCHFDFSIGVGNRRDPVILIFGQRVTKTDERKLEAEFSHYFQNAPIALHWLSRDGVIVWANKMEMDMLGYSREEYIGQPINKFAYPNDRAIVTRMLQQLDTGQASQDLPVRFQAKDGSLVYLLINSDVRYDINGNFDHIRCFIRDDTVRRIRDARTKILLEETKRSQTMLDNFMSRSLHHLRTPLHVMEHTNDLLSERLAEWQQHHTASDIMSESINLVQESKHYVARAVGLIDDISDLARLDQGLELSVTSHKVDVRELGLDILDETLMPKNKGVELSLVLRDGTPASITADDTILQRIIMQLLEHALEETKGNIIFSIGRGSIPSRVKFAIEHAGIDMREKEREGEDELLAGEAGTLPSIFQRYHQELVPEELYDSDKAEDLRAKIETRMSAFHTTTLGIGLSLSYHMIHALGGELRYQFRNDGETELGTSKFWFSIPCSPEYDEDLDIDNEAFSFEQVLSYEEISKKSRLGCKDEEMTIVRKHGRNQSMAGSMGDSDHSNKRHKSEVTDDTHLSFARSITPPMSVASGIIEAEPLVLIVEDTDICAKLIATVLGKLQIPSAHARNGEEALEMLRSVPNGLYTLVLMDLRMPVMDGFEATRAIKKYLKLDVPVIALTGETKEVVREKCEEIGFDGFISKPMKRKQLEEIIRKYIPQRKSIQ